MPELAMERNLRAQYKPIPPDEAVTQISHAALEKVLDALGGSEYWRSLPFELAQHRLRELSTLGPNWDSYGAETPNEAAVNTATMILGLLKSMYVPPTRVVASSEGGVGICFVHEDSYADFECFNDGEIVAVSYRGTDEPLVWEVAPEEESIKAAIEQIRAQFTA
jgi:hypothetical protein